MTSVVRFAVSSTSRIDDAARVRLENTVGPARGAEILSDACFEIVERLTQFEVAIIAARREAAVDLARGIARVAASIGLPELERAAHGAANCQCCGDPAARRATQQRLIRVGEASLDALLDGPGQ